MKDRQLILIKLEQQLTEREVSLFREENQLEQLEEDYFGHFAKASHLFTDIRFLFQRTDEAQFVEALSHEVYHGSRKMEESVLTVRKCVKAQRKSVQKQLSDISVEYQKLNGNQEMW